MIQNSLKHEADLKNESKLNGRVPASGKTTWGQNDNGQNTEYRGSLPWLEVACVSVYVCVCVESVITLYLFICLLTQNEET